MSGYESWDTAFEGGSGASGAKTDFVKFPEGITKLRLMDTKIHVRWVHWMPQFKRSVNCPGSNKCSICALRKAAKDAGETPKYALSKRFAVNVINRETKAYEILDQGKEFFDELRIVRMEGINPSDPEDAVRGEVTGYDVKVRRTGMKQEDTKYRIDADKVYPMSDEDNALVADAKDLMEYFKPHTTEQIDRLLKGEAWADVMTTQDAPVAEKEEVIEVE